MPRTIGLMSGTSLDGVDAAWLETDGETVTAFGPTIRQSRTMTPCAATCGRSRYGSWSGARRRPASRARRQG